MFFKIGILKNFKFQNVIFLKIFQVFRSATLLKGDPITDVFL